jgi:carbamate kinase
MRVVIALGGNALLRRGEAPDARIQLEHVAAAAPALAEAAADHELLITHGNGPQVGLLAIESSDDRSLSVPYPLDALVAETQGLIGYWLQQSIAAAGLTRPIVALVTQTVVAGDDPAFADPTKFIGAVYAEAEVDALRARGWTVRRDGNGFRRVVPSPTPRRVVEREVIDALLRDGTTVIAAGGGGAPVIEADDGRRGVEAVVDKDLVAALLALELGAELLVLLTDVPAVLSGFGTPQERPLGAVTVDELERETFAPGSMGPKVAAACRFARESGHPAVIGALDDLAAVLRGEVGTRVERGAATKRP